MFLAFFLKTCFYFVIQICVGKNCWFGVAFYLEKRKIVFSFSVSQGTMAGNVVTGQTKTQKMNTIESGMF